ARTAADVGFAGLGLPQICANAALTALAVIGREVDGIELGTGVVPTYPRHPMMLAAQALTTNAAVGGRFTLGIGLSHQIVVESMLGYSYDKPARHMREYLSILVPLIREGSVSFAGETLTFHGTVGVPGSTPCPVLVAALGPMMLELTGSMADGTVTWMTGPATVADHIGPSIRRAAAGAGRPDPRIVSALPVLVTDDPDEARQRAATTFSIYGDLPAYRAMLDREGVAGPADVAVVGDEATVAAGIARMADAGATDFLAVEFGITDGERTRTRDLLRTLL
ncbi:MAG: TIGR03564 family F420-dependent LLM class oxidoreductase, partial [Acidimicrobiales bacterium]